MKNAVILALVASSLATAATAADVPATPANATAPAMIVLKAAHLFDGKSGQLVSPGVVVVQGEHIVAVGPAAKAMPGACVIDPGDATLLPGFIDAHTHMSSDYNENWSDKFYKDALRSVPEQSFHAARNARALLMAGVT